MFGIFIDKKRGIEFGVNLATVESFHSLSDSRSIMLITSEYRYKIVFKTVSENAQFIVDLAYIGTTKKRKKPNAYLIERSDMERVKK